jgi:hypothetical protein
MTRISLLRARTIARTRPARGHSNFPPVWPAPPLPSELARCLLFPGTGADFSSPTPPRQACLHLGWPRCCEPPLPRPVVGRPWHEPAAPVPSSASAPVPAISGVRTAPHRRSGERRRPCSHWCSPPADSPLGGVPSPPRDCVG